MKTLTLVSLLLMATSSFAATSIDKCVDDALTGASNSLAANNQIKKLQLSAVKTAMELNEDAQYLQTRHELETLCRRLYIGALDLGE